MTEITLEKKFSLYIDTLDKCGQYLLSVSDEIISYNIFEEFDGGATSFLHKKNLNTLLYNGLIDDNIYQKSLKLREKFMLLQNTSLWNLESVKTTKEWLEILKLSDQIKKLLHQRWTNSELEILTKS